MHMDPLLPAFVAAAFGILLIGAAARRLRQPYVIAYLLAGVLLGPDGAAVFTDVPTLARLGEVGVILLLFFVGMEVDVANLALGWRVSIVGTLLQVLASVLCIAGIGLVLDWSIGRIVLLGFAISLSSTALVVSMLREWNELDTPAGRDSIGVLLAQDLAIVPMLLCIGFLGGQGPSGGQVLLQVLGGSLVVLVVVYLARGGSLKLPFGDAFRSDHELQVFGAFLLCSGCAWVTGFLGLSTALGAFVAGLVVGAARETEWVHRSLEPFRVLFVAVFFVSVGALIDLGFLTDHWQLVALLVLATLATNTLINAGILRALRRGWATSLYAGALLSQIGEFSFVLAAVGNQAGIVGDFAYQAVVCTIAGSLLLSPAWILLFRSRRGESARPANA
jgi:CPA2 family monovalent cation:H+ antiporter-2